MTTQTTVSVDALDSLIEDGDTLINLTSAALSCSVPFVECSQDGKVKIGTGQPTPVAQDVSAESIQALQTDAVKRFVIVSDGSQVARELSEQLTSAGIANSSIVLAEDCAADSFMDEDDSEAVAERLRQLGYI